MACHPSIALLLSFNFEVDLVIMDDEDDLILILAVAAGEINRRSARRKRSGFYKTVESRFQLEAITAEACLLLFRFQHSHILFLRSLLFAEAVVSLENRCVVPSTEALCIMLNRFCYPNRLEAMEKVFGRHFSVLARVVNKSIDVFIDRFGHLLSISTSNITSDSIRSFMGAVSAKGAPLHSCFGFVDGTVRPICRPSRKQKQAYNGHKRVHALKYQAVSAPNGIIIDLAGPWEGRRHDCGMLRESGLLDRLQKICDRDGPAYIYGDPAYPVSHVLQCPFKGSHLSDEQL
jgi:nuclease HARBI1